jgi:NAD(P)-dependent dehydrogenase (short-subunit alcohol dehydrogenase family)
MPDDVVLITPANDGIGLGRARALSALGSRVACLDLTGERLSGLWYLPCDVTDAARVEAAVLMSRLMPRTMGKFLSARAAAARAKAARG